MGEGEGEGGLLGAVYAYVYMYVAWILSTVVCVHSPLWLRTRCAKGRYIGCLVL